MTVGWETRDMLKIKPKTTTIFLLLVTFLLIGSIAYISSILTTGSGETSKIAPKKTKAASITYSKYLALNTAPGGLNPTATLIPTSGPTSAISPTIMISITNTPTPTEVVLAYNNPSITITKAASTSATTPTITSIKNLPSAGFVYNGLVIFAAATLLVFFSFLY